MVEVEIYVDGILRTMGGVTEATKCEEIIRKIGKTFKKRGHLSLAYKCRGINSEIPWLLPLHGKFLSIVNFLKSRLYHSGIIFLNVKKDTQKLPFNNSNGNNVNVGIQNLIRKASNTTKISHFDLKTSIENCFIPHLNLLDLRMYMHIYQKLIPDTNIVSLMDFIIDQYLLILFIEKCMGKIENIEDFLEPNCFKKYLNLIIQQQQPSQELHISALVANLNEEIKSKETLTRTVTHSLQLENGSSFNKVEDIRYWEQKIRDKDIELSVQNGKIQDLQSSIKKAQQELTCYVENRIRNFDANLTTKSIVPQSHGVWV